MIDSESEAVVEAESYSLPSAESVSEVSGSGSVESFWAGRGD